jgi:hypothetical protein
MYRLFDPVTQRYVSVALYYTIESAENALTRARIRAAERKYRLDLGTRPNRWIVKEYHG